MLILASSSPRRLELLRQAGVVPDRVVPADIDETPIKGELPAAYARRISASKAGKVAGDHKNAVILAADTVVGVGRRILPKTETEEQARDCLALMSGRRHRVMTSVTIVGPDGKARTKVVTSVVAFKRLTKNDISTYIACGEWKGKAGGYAIQGLAAAYISFISGSYTGIVGLPLLETMHLLEAAGYERH